MFVSEIIAALEKIAPPAFAAEWDNVGLLAGSRAWSADRVLLTTDLTREVLREAIDAKTRLVISYHPPIFEPLKSITDAADKQRLILEALREGIAIYSPHTALDAAEGGINDWLAAGLGAGDVRALQPFADLPESEQYKIITYCPAEAVDPIRNALAAIGAGAIGAYRLCSFEISGTGTFIGGEDTNPAVGARHELNRVSEVRLEMVCPRRALALAVTSLRQFHPYEEPPIEILRFEERPRRGVGQGRRVVLDQALSLKTLLQRIKTRLGAKRLQVAVPPPQPQGQTHGARKYSRVGVCAGAGGSLLESAIAQDCQAFVTGEMRHHDVLAAIARGCTIILAGHTATERPYLRVLARRLRDAVDVETLVSKRDVDPLRVI